LLDVAPGIVTCVSARDAPTRKAALTVGEMLAKLVPQTAPARFRSSLRDLKEAQLRAIQPLIDDMLAKAAAAPLAIVAAPVAVAPPPKPARVLAQRMTQAAPPPTQPVTPDTPPDTPPEPPTPARMRPRTPPEEEESEWDPTSPTVLADLEAEIAALTGPELCALMFTPKPGVKVRVSLASLTPRRPLKCSTRALRASLPSERCLLFGGRC